MTYLEALNTEDVNMIGDAFCDLMSDTAVRIFHETKNNYDLLTCDACPFRDFCSEDRKTRNGFTEWLKQRWD